MWQKIQDFYWENDIEIDIFGGIFVMLALFLGVLWGLSVFSPPAAPSSQSITSE